MFRWSRLLATALVLAMAVPALAQDRTPPPADSDSPFTVRLKSGSFVPSPGVEGQLAEKAATLPGTWVGLVQLRDIPDEALRAELAARGVELLSYLPEKTWIARLQVPPSTALSLADVRWVGRLLPQDKIDPEAAIAFTGPTGLVYKRGRQATVAVETVPGATDQVAEALAGLGASVVERDDQLDLLIVEVSADQVLALTRIEPVVWVDVQQEKALFNDLSRIRTRAEEVQAAPYSLDGSGVQLGIWDGGRIWNHPDFTGRLNMIDLGGALDNHATHVAGTMAGDGSLGVTFGLPVNLRGMAPAADIVGYDFAGSTDVEHNGAINTWGIDLSQNSWGYRIEQALPFNNCFLYGNYDTLTRNYDRIVTGLYGTRIPVVFANGNERNDGDCGMSAVPPFLNYSVVSPPATAKNVISVGAINGDDGAMTSFSSWGPVDDGRIKPEIVAPGCNVAGLQNLPGIVSTFRDTTNNVFTYAANCGTSMAAPAVSGNIGLLLERYRDVCPTGGTDPLPSTVKALLVHGAVDLDDTSSFLNPGPDYASGYGSLDIKASIDLLPFHVEDDVAQGVTDTYQILVTQQDDLKVTLVWDDVAATAGAAVTLVNNLDLQLVDPNGGIHRPWILNPASPANAATTGVDNRNVVEQVVVPTVSAANAGTWTIRVIGTSVPNGPQGYSLVSQHLDQTSCNGAPAGDAWIMDKDLPLTPVDPGTEPNPDTGPMWISNQIWVRNDDDGGLTHENPDFGQDNYIYARVRNNGTTTLDTVRAMVYYAHASTGLSWPGQWHLIGSSTVVDLAPGGSVVIDPVTWDPPAQGHYCLVVRLLTPQDPMTFPEGPSIGVNTRNNNNIAWRNVNVVDILPNSEGGFTVLSRNVLEEDAEIELVLDMSRDRGGRTLLDAGVGLELQIDEESFQQLIERGIQFDGQGVERVDDRTLVVTSPTVVLGPWRLGGGQEIRFDVVWRAPATLVPLQKPYILDVNQNFGRTFAPVADADQNVRVTLGNSPDDPNVGGIRYEITLHEK